MQELFRDPCVHRLRLLFKPKEGAPETEEIMHEPVNTLDQINQKYEISWIVSRKIIW